MLKKNKKFELKLIKKIVKEEATDAFIDYNVEFDFLELDKEVQTIYVFENRESQNSVEFYMLENLSKRIKEINPRYQVGIMYEEKATEEEYE